MKTIEELKDIATQIRRDVLRMINGAKSGHPGGALGTADFFTYMYNGFMNINPSYSSIDGAGEDMFFLSNGHLSSVWYSTLARRGYIDIKELSSFRKLNSRLQGHPTNIDGLPCIRVASGSLGQGLSVAIGAALGKKLSGDKNIVYCLMGDGELQEGQIWEAMMYAGSKKVDNLVGIVDWNNKQIDGSVENVMDLGDLRGKCVSFGWDVLEMNGNNFNDIILNMNIAKGKLGKGKPVMVLMHTVMGFGVDFMENDHRWHGTPLNDEQLKRALLQLPETLGDY